MLHCFSEWATSITSYFYIFLLVALCTHALLLMDVKIHVDFLSVTGEIWLG